jgi:hypothetical protein
MSIGSLGIIGGLAGTTLPQRAVEAEKVGRETIDQARAADATERAEDAAGIGQTEEDSQASERDADGRRQWEESAQAKKAALEQAADALPIAKSKDPTHTCGSQLDLVG